MASELKLSGTTARVILQGNDTISSDQTFTFPDSGGEVVTSTFNGNVTFGSSVTINDPANTSGHFFGAGGGAEHTVASGTVGTTPVLSVIKGSGNSTFQVTADGGASFVGGRARLASDGNFELYNGSNQVVAISAGDGSATFSDDKITLSGDGTAFFYRPTTTSSRSILHVSSDVNGTNSFAFYVTANGVISARSTAISQIGSERRIKKDIELIDPVKSWETIRDLPYYSYKLKENDQSTYYGPIVDECPEEMVVEGTTSDEEGNIRTYDNSILQSRLFVALQTALTRIEQLESRLAQLEGQS